MEAVTDWTVWQMPEGPQPLVGRLGRPITGRHACRVRAAASSQRGPTLSPGLLSCIYSVKQLQISHLSLNPYSCYIIGNKSVFIPDMSVYNILQTWLPYIGLHYFVALFNQMFKKCIVRNWNTTCVSAMCDCRLLLPVLARTLEEMFNLNDDHYFQLQW